MEDHLPDGYDHRDPPVQQSLFRYLVYRRPDRRLGGADPLVRCGLFCEEPFRFCHEIRPCGNSHPVYPQPVNSVNFVDQSSAVFRTTGTQTDPFRSWKLKDPSRKPVPKEGFFLSGMEYLQTGCKKGPVIHILSTGRNRMVSGVCRVFHRIHSPYYYY